MKQLRWISIALIILAVVALSLRFMLIKLEPGEIGVLNAEWTTGLVEEDYGPGYHWNVGPLHTWSILDGRVQTLHMHRDRDRAGRTEDAQVYEALQLKSNDGATITLDITLKYRIKPGNGWRLFKTFGSTIGYQEKVRNTALDVLRLSLGELEAEQFYDPRVRRNMVSRMENNLRQQLDALHVELIGILVRDLAFDDKFTDRIKRKTLATEERELNIEQTKAEQKRGETNKISAETEALVLVIDQEREKTIREMRAQNDKEIAEITATYKQRVQELESDADLYAELKEAEGIVLLRGAEAKGQALRRNAVSGTGGAVLVALELARSLNLGDMAVSTQGTNPLDIDAMMRKLGLTK